MQQKIIFFTTDMEAEKKEFHFGIVAIYQEWSSDILCN